MDDALEQLDHTLDALRALHPDSSAVASMRALTDLEVWRTLRGHGTRPMSP